MMFKQILAILLGLGFVVLTALHYNRPDAVIWISVYLSVAIFSFMVVLDKISRALLLAAFVGYSAGAFYFWPGELAVLDLRSSEIMQADMVPVSDSLAIAGIAMLLFALLTKKKTDLHPPHIPGSIKKWAN
ncbi:MAG: transmembrane 220 family protein [Hymenobacteraceae bacterium]|nr:transmembrane 220 family protein [Hymenobacteraceae bacterium]